MRITRLTQHQLRNWTGHFFHTELFNILVLFITVLWSFQRQKFYSTSETFVEGK